MIQKTRNFCGLLAVLVFTLVLGACFNKSAKSDASALRLSDQVHHIDSTDLSSLLSSPNPFMDNLHISDGGLGGDGKITNGQLSYIIKAPRLSPINEGLGFLAGKYSNIRFSPEDANAAALALGTNSEKYSGLFKNLLSLNAFSKIPTIIVETVNYVYVDKDVKITAGSNNSTYNDLGFPVSLTTENINLSLKKGWNPLYSRIIAEMDIPLGSILSQDFWNLDLTDLESTGTLSMSVLDPPTLKWTLVPLPPPDL